MVSPPPRRSYRVCSVIVTPPSPSWAERILPMVLYCLYARCTLLVRAPERPSSTMQLFGYGCITVGPDPSLLPLIHPSASKEDSPKFAAGFGKWHHALKLANRGRPAEEGESICPATSKIRQGSSRLRLLSTW